MELFTDIVETFFRALGSIAFLFLLTKLMGAKQISQLTFFDYIIGISIGSIVGILAIDRETHFSHPLVTMAVYAVADYLIGIITRKSILARRFFNGTSKILVYDGKIIRDNMRSTHYDINELLAVCRTKGYFNIADIKYAILETSGDISLLPKSDRRPINPADMQIYPEQEGLVANLVIDGKIMRKNLAGIGRDEPWLRQKLAEQHYKEVSDVLLATCDNTGAVSVYHRNEAPPTGGILD